MIKSLLEKCLPNPLDRILKKAEKRYHKRVLFTWNRGLGDIALGLYALTFRIREFLPDAHITCITRTDLAEGFSLLKNVDVLAAPKWKRGNPFDLDETLASFSLKREDFDLILENPDVTKWLKWQLGTLTPKLVWSPSWDALCERFGLEKGKKYVGVHVQTETNYNYEKNWPLASWKNLFEKLISQHDYHVLLFGFSPSPSFDQKRIIDLRGKTTLFEMLSLIKNHCSLLVVPDSGVLSLTYFLDVETPLKIISLWADPHQGVLKQNVASPNRNLIHIPLTGPSRDVSQISVETVLEKINAT